MQERVIHLSPAAFHSNTSANNSLHDLMKISRWPKLVRPPSLVSGERRPPPLPRRSSGLDPVMMEGASVTFRLLGGVSTVARGSDVAHRSYATYE